MRDATDPPAPGHGFGTLPVFLTSISTILGAVMFLRFGYAVGHLGLLGAVAIILIGHAVTIPTALAIAEIATNRRVEGGGEYFIISRSFGTTIGGAIGFSLYLSQAISVAFYLIAFAEAFRPAGAWLEEIAGMAFDPRAVSVPALLALSAVVLSRGAGLGVRALRVVVTILLLSLVLFFLGSAPAGIRPEGPLLVSELPDPDPFILVFAIVFPAFTGMTAGVGLSGDLANPRRSIPLGILSATGAGVLVYLIVFAKLASSANAELLAGDPLVMSRIALWGPIIPIGLASATLSSAIGSVLVAPRTLQALASDGIIPAGAGRVLAEGRGEANEPRNATLLTAVVALVFVLLGDVDIVARIVSMFFMVTYGALCAISFLEHFAARPSYRPSFRSKWYISLFGAVMSFLLMLQMDPVYAVTAIVVMTGLYLGIRRSRDGIDDLAAIFHGVMTQATRYLQVRLQKSPPNDWRPSVIMVTGSSFRAAAPIQMLEWLCNRYGVGTYLHYIRGRLDPATFEKSREVQDRLVQSARDRKGAIYVDTMISPSPASALAQSFQMPGVSGVENNTVVFELGSHDPPEALDGILTGLALAGVPRMNRLVLRHGESFFGHRKTIHVWLTPDDARNANLMVLLAYILLGHRDWRRAEVDIFAVQSGGGGSAWAEELHAMIAEGRLLLSEKNLTVIPGEGDASLERLVEARSAVADLVLLGFADADIDSGQTAADAAAGAEHPGRKAFTRYSALQDVLFVSAAETIRIE